MSAAPQSSAPERRSQGCYIGDVHVQGAPSGPLYGLTAVVKVRLLPRSAPRHCCFLSCLRRVTLEKGACLLLKSFLSSCFLDVPQL